MYPVLKIMQMLNFLDTFSVGITEEGMVPRSNTTIILRFKEHLQSIYIYIVKERLQIYLHRSLHRNI